MSASSDTARVRVLPALLVAGIVAAAPVAAGTQPPRIAFDYGPAANHPDVATTAADGSDLVNLTPGTQDFFTADMHPSWSPDGTQIAFDSHRVSNVSTEIYAMNADGTDQRRLTQDSGPNGIFNSQPHWSPRGDLIEFLKSRAGQSYDIWVMRPDGSGQRALTGDGNIKLAVSWSPDGTRLVYTRSEGSASRVYTVGLDGTPPVVLSPADAYDTGPVWSPDGSQIAFSAPALTVINADGSGRHRVTDLSTASPAWSPDGTRIAFTGYRSFPQYGSRFGIPTRQDVFVVDADGGNLRRLTGPFDDAEFGGPFAYSPTWWPDGSRLFYVGQRNLGPYTTFVMNADGTCESLLAPDTPGLLDPVWQPGGGPLPPITHCAELRLSAAVSKTPVALDEATSFTFTIDNDGNEGATNVQLRIDAGEAVLSVLSTGGGECGAVGTEGVSTVVCTVDAIPRGETVRVTIGGERRSAGPIRLRGSVLAGQLDTDPTNNSASTGADVLPCTQVGTYANDVLYGTDGPDRICGLPGADTIVGRKGNDFIDAGNGDDRVYPGPGRDTVIAKGGDDVIYARDGERDWIDCGAGKDVAVIDRIDVVRHCEYVARPPR